jgi:hypothetical protein
VKRHHQPSGLHQGIELLDDLRDRMWSHYELALLTKLREERGNHRHVPISDPPF